MGAYRIGNCLLSSSSYVVNTFKVCVCVFYEHWLFIFVATATKGYHRLIMGILKMEFTANEMFHKWFSVSHIYLGRSRSRDRDSHHANIWYKTIQKSSPPESVDRLQ